MRVRGLKLGRLVAWWTTYGSHPMRVRGLKSIELDSVIRDDRVAPHAGAWIEMYKHRKEADIKRVAPHAGAWIEIVNARLCSCGALVAPHAGAWIEIVITPSCTL